MPTAKKVFAFFLSHKNPASIGENGQPNKWVKIAIALRCSARVRRLARVKVYA
jgi:hypothetical protein